MNCNEPYLIRIRLSERQPTLSDLERSCHISQWIQSMKIRKESKLLFEGYDGISYGIFSKEIIIPDWFQKKYSEDFGVSANW